MFNSAAQSFAVVPPRFAYFRVSNSVYPDRLHVGEISEVLPETGELVVTSVCSSVRECEVHIPFTDILGLSDQESFLDNFVL